VLIQSALCRQPPGNGTAPGPGHQPSKSGSCSRRLPLRAGGRRRRSCGGCGGGGSASPLPSGGGGSAPLPRPPLLPDHGAAGRVRLHPGEQIPVQQPGQQQQHHSHQGGGGRGGGGGGDHSAAGCCRRAGLTTRLGKSEVTLGVLYSC
jgi:hypothetical protein